LFHCSEAISEMGRHGVVETKRKRRPEKAPFSFNAACHLREDNANPNGGATWQSHRIPPATGDVLLQRRIERRELGVERGAQTVHRSDDRERNASGDQAVFNGGGAAFVFQKSANQKRQITLLVLKWMPEPAVPYGGTCGKALKNLPIALTSDQ
jgi:hypothetical protein